jgi:hypothetical protein
MRIPQLVVSLVLVGAAALASSGAKANVLVTVDKSTQTMTVAVDGMTRWTWPVSTGRAGYATPSGSFQAFRMEATHFSKEWDDAPMPHSIFFTKIGHAIHGTYEVSHLGTAVSHGCVRLSTANAAQLYALVKEEGLPNTQVVITGTQPYGEPEAYNSQSYQQNNWFGQNSSGQGWGQNASNQGWGQNSSNQGWGQGWFGQNSNGQNSNGQNSATQRVRGQQTNSDGNYRRDNGFSFFDSRN